MKKVFIINGGQKFSGFGGSFNATIANWTKELLESHNFEIRITDINDEYDSLKEVENFKWADIVVYHFPIWWFHFPNRLKLYIDEVFTAGHENGIYKNDGRSSINPEINYGTGGLMQGKQYFVTTSWNAPETAFTLKGEFFKQQSVDGSILFAFHRMNEFIGMSFLGSYHFYDMKKSVSKEKVDQYEIEYKEYVKNKFSF